MSRLPISSLAAKKGREKIAVLSCYTAPIARLADQHMDMLLVGDSLGMTVYGMDSTRGVPLDMMIAHGRAVVNASKRSSVVVDMPFGSYHATQEQSFANCAMVMTDTGSCAVKLEGGESMAETILHLTGRGIPVMGHVGLMPQYVDALTGFKAQGRTPEEREQILRDARAVEAAGAFAIVLEGIDELLAREITQALSIPTIGIGASPACDGQVLVIDDLAGITPKTPRFVKRYAELGTELEKAISAYAHDVKSGAFPQAEHTYNLRKN